MQDKQQSDLAQKLVNIAKQNPEYDAEVVKREVSQLIEMAYSPDKSPLNDLFRLYQKTKK